MGNVVIITHSEENDPHKDRLAAIVSQSGHACTVVADNDLRRIPRQDAPFAFLLLESVPTAIRVARRIHTEFRTAHIAFVADAEREIKLRQEMGIAPLLGNQWSFVRPDEQAFAKAIE